MSPSWARKGSKRWRYYVSQAALQGDKSKAGSIVRVPAAYVEGLVADAIAKLSSNRADSQTDIRNLIDASRSAVLQSKSNCQTPGRQKRARGH